MRINFKCGCFLSSYFGQDGNERAGLACCNVHEKPYAKVEELGLLEVASLSFSNFNEVCESFDDLPPQDVERIFKKVMDKLKP